VHPSLTILWLGLGCLAFAQWRLTGQKWLFALFSVVVGLTILKLLLFDAWTYGTMRSFYTNGFENGLLSMRLIDFGSVIALLTIFFLYFRNNKAGNAMVTFGYLSLALFFIYSTLELITYVGKYLPEFLQGGLSIYWAAFGISLLLLGITKQLRHLRIVALCLLGLVISKVFFYDLSDLEQIYRIIAFIILGMLVIGGSFLYLKFRSNFENVEPKN
jgi:hypothetical protein